MYIRCKISLRRKRFSKTYLGHIEHSVTTDKNLFSHRMHSQRDGQMCTLGTFSTRVFSRNLKRQPGRGHAIKPCGHVRSSQRAFSTPRGRFSRKRFT